MCDISSHASSIVSKLTDFQSFERGTVTAHQSFWCAVVCTPLSNHGVITSRNEISCILSREKAHVFVSSFDTAFRFIRLTVVRKTAFKLGTPLVQFTPHYVKFWQSLLFGLPSIMSAFSGPWLRLQSMQPDRQSSRRWRRRKKSSRSYPNPNPSLGRSKWEKRRKEWKCSWKHLTSFHFPLATSS